jgi:hypothetical protein
MKPYSLPVLPNIRVASPCMADWNAMMPVDLATRVRHCDSCKEHVYNLSGMTRAEAEALIVANKGKLCVRFYQRKDGTILLKDCTVGAANAKKRKLVAAGALALFASGAGAVALRQHDTHAIAASTIDNHVAEDVRLDERGLPEVAHDDPPPPPTLTLEPTAPAGDGDWHAIKGKVAIDHFDNLEDVK